MRTGEPRLRGCGRSIVGVLTLVCTLLFVLVPGFALAGTVSLVLTTRVTVAPKSLRVHLDVQNRGDDAALKLTPTIEFQGHIVSAPSVDALQPSATHTLEFDVPLTGLTTPKGTWPLLVRAAYVDAAGYPFEALHVDRAAFNDDEWVSPVRIQLPDVHVRGEARFRASIDRAGVEGPIRLGFATPAGLLITPKIYTLAPGADTVSLVLAVTGATVDSQLPLVAMAEYDEAGGHHAVTAVSTITVGAPDASRPRRVVFSLLFALTVVVWVVLAIRTRRRRRSTPDD